MVYSGLGRLGKSRRVGSRNRTCGSEVGQHYIALVLHHVSPTFGWAVQYKLCRVRSCALGDKGVPYITTNDGRTIRYPDPLIKVNDTIKVDIETGKASEFIKFDIGNMCMVTGEYIPALTSGLKVVCRAQGM